MKDWLSVVVLSSLLFTGPAWAQVYKCRTPDGGVEYANKPCANAASTLKTIPEERVPEANRRAAEREAERMREYVEKREAEQQAAAAALRERERQAAASAPRPAPPPTSSRSTEECLNDLDQRALEPHQRSELEAACRNNPATTPVYVPVPVPSPVIGGSSNPVDLCIANVLRMRLAPDEQQLRMAQCQQVTTAPQPYFPPQIVAPPRPMAPAPQPAKPDYTPNVICPPNNKNCAR